MADLLAFSPQDQLEFLFDSSGYYSNLYVSNPSGYPVAFKVKTNNPERYLVRPNQGVLGAHTSNLEVRVVVMNEPLEALYREMEAAGGQEYCPADKFLVQFIALTSQEFASFSAEDATELQHRLSALWVDPQYKSRILSHRLKCRYSWGDASVDATAAGDNSLFSPGGTVKEEPLPHEDTDTTSLSLAVSGGDAVSSQNTVNQPPAFTTASAATSSSAAAAASAARDTLTFEQLKDLREKYNTLVNESVRMAAQREELTAALNERATQVEALQDEVRSLRVQLDTASSGLRKRATKVDEPPATPAAPATPTAGSGAVVEPPSKSGIPIWLVIVLAAIMFLIGRLL